MKFTRPFSTRAISILSTSSPRLTLFFRSFKRGWAFLSLLFKILKWALDCCSACYCRRRLSGSKTQKRNTHSTELRAPTRIFNLSKSISAQTTRFELAQAVPNRFLVDPLNRSGTSARTVLVASEANIPTSGVTRHAPPPSKPSLQTYGRDTRHRPIATSREFLPAGGKKRGKTHKPPAALDAVVPRFPRGGGGISRRRPAPVVTLRRVVSIDTRYVTATRWMHIFIYIRASRRRLARLVVVTTPRMGARDGSHRVADGASG